MINIETIEGKFYHSDNTFCFVRESCRNIGVFFGDTAKEKAQELKQALEKNNVYKLKRICLNMRNNASQIEKMLEPWDANIIANVEQWDMWRELAYAVDILEEWIEDLR